MENAARQVVSGMCLTTGGLIVLALCEVVLKWNPFS